MLIKKAAGFYLQLFLFLFLLGVLFGECKCKYILIAKGSGSLASIKSFNNIHQPASMSVDNSRCQSMCT